MTHILKRINKDVSMMDEHEIEKIWKFRGGGALEHIELPKDDEIVNALENIVDNNMIYLLNRVPIEIPLTDTQNKIFPDYISYKLPIISEKIKNIFDDNKIDNIYYKPLILTTGREKHNYWLMCVPFIECFEEIEEDFETMYKLHKEKIGNYKIFRDISRGPGVIFVTDKIKAVIEKDDSIKGVYFYEDSEEE